MSYLIVPTSAEMNEIKNKLADSSELQRIDGLKQIKNHIVADHHDSQLYRDPLIKKSMDIYETDPHVRSAAFSCIGEIAAYELFHDIHQDPHLPYMGVVAAALGHEKDPSVTEYALNVVDRMIHNGNIRKLSQNGLDSLSLSLKYLQDNPNAPDYLKECAEELLYDLKNLSGLTKTFNNVSVSFEVEDNLDLSDINATRHSAVCEFENRIKAQTPDENGLYTVRGLIQGEAESVDIKVPLKAVDIITTDLLNQRYTQFDVMHAHADGAYTVEMNDPKPL